MGFVCVGGGGLKDCKADVIKTMTRLGKWLSNSLTRSEYQTDGRVLSVCVCVCEQHGKYQCLNV